MNGIRGYEGRRRRCKLEGRSLYRTTKESQGAREVKKLVSKLNWYRSEKKTDYYVGGSRNNGRKEAIVSCRGAKHEYKSVLFVEQTVGGELARRLCELLQRLGPVGVEFEVNANSAQLSWS